MKGKKNNDSLVIKSYLIVIYKSRCYADVYVRLSYLTLVVLKNVNYESENVRKLYECIRECSEYAGYYISVNKVFIVKMNKQFERNSYRSKQNAENLLLKKSKEAYDEGYD